MAKPECDPLRTAKAAVEVIRMQAEEAIRLIEEAIAKCEKGSGGTPPPAEEPPPEYPGLDGP